jgi:hypothetical protein
MTPEEALEWIVDHFFHRDQANGAIHCDQVRYSPITIAAAQAYRDVSKGELSYAAQKILSAVVT